MAIAPVETAYDPLRPPGAVMVQRDGLPVVGPLRLGLRRDRRLHQGRRAGRPLERPPAGDQRPGRPARPRARGRGARRRALPGRARLHRRHVVLPRHRPARDRRGRPQRGGPLAPGRQPGDLDRRPGRDQPSRSSTPRRCPSWGRARRGSRSAAAARRHGASARSPTAAWPARRVSVVREDGDHLPAAVRAGPPDRRLAGALGRRPRARAGPGGQRGARAAPGRAPPDRLGGTSRVGNTCPEGKVRA